MATTRLRDESLPIPIRHTALARWTGLVTVP